MRLVQFRDGGRGRCVGIVSDDGNGFERRGRRPIGL